MIFINRLYATDLNNKVTKLNQGSLPLITLEDYRLGGKEDI